MSLTTCPLRLSSSARVPPPTGVPATSAVNSRWRKATRSAPVARTSSSAPGSTSALSSRRAPAPPSSSMALLHSAPFGQTHLPPELGVPVAAVVLLALQDQGGHRGGTPLGVDG